MSIKEDLIAIVGTQHVTDEPEKLRRYARDVSLEKPAMPSYVAEPKDAAEVQELVKLANRVRLPVYPCSSGIHTCGNTLPRLGGLIVDLRRMNKIRRINTRDRIAMVEPGVTWGQLQKEVAKEELFALNPLLPHPQKSVLTSHLEREKMLIPKYEYSDNLLTTEVILPNGELFRTGSASVVGYPDKSVATGVHPEGPGADWWRLLQGAQGTMGIVTWANVKLEYKPKLNKTLFIPFKDIEAAVRFIYAAQHRMVGNECLLLNNVNLAAILAEKWQDDFHAIKKMLPPWILIFVLSGGKRFSGERIAYEEEALQKIAVEQYLPGLPASLPGLLGAEKQFPELLRSSWPQDRPYWKYAWKGASQDLFCLTVMSRAGEYAAIINRAAERHGYPPGEIGYYLQPVERGRVCHFEASFFYNPEDGEEAGRVAALYREAAKNLFVADAFFSRPYGEIARMVYDKAGNYTAVLKKVKNWLDPNDIMAPDRLGI